MPTPKESLKIPSSEGQDSSYESIFSKISDFIFGYCEVSRVNFILSINSDQSYQARKLPLVVKKNLQGFFNLILVKWYTFFISVFELVAQFSDNILVNLDASLGLAFF